MSEIKTDEIKLSPEKPPKHIYDRAKIHLDVDFEDGIVFVYGDTIHTKYKISQDIFEHEATHVKQQKKLGPDKWWDMYLNLPEFRLDQEIEAYRNQYKYLKKHIKDREKLFRELHRISGYLSSPMYGNILSYQQAMQAIRSVL